MKIKRSSHKTLVFGERMVHIGGKSKYSFEIWTDLGKNHFAKSFSQEQLKNWHHFPNAFTVGPDDYE